MSPEQRAKNKRLVGAWVPQEIADEIERRAKLRGVAKSDIAQEMIREGLRRHGYGDKKGGGK